MKNTEMALVSSSAEEGKLRLEVVDDTPERHNTVCVIKIDVCDVGGLLAGRRFAPIVQSVPQEKR